MAAVPYRPEGVVSVKAKFVRLYTTGSGVQFMVFEGPEGRRIDVKTRADRHSVPLLTRAEAKQEAIRRLTAA
jgi:hypothetical protein